MFDLKFSLFLLLKGNALKDSGRVEEAIQCYRVGFYHPVFQLNWFISEKCNYKILSVVNFFPLTI